MHDSTMNPCNRNIHQGNSTAQSASTSDTNNRSPILSESCLNKLVDEIDMYAAIILLEEKRRNIWSEEAGSKQMTEQMKVTSFKRIGNLMMEITPAMIRLDSNTYSRQIDEIYKRCLAKWNVLKPTVYLREVQYVEQWIGRCFGEIQRRNFMNTRSTQAVRSSMNITAPLNGPSHDNVSSQAPTQRALPSQATQAVMNPMSPRNSLPQNYMPSQPPTQAPARLAPSWQTSQPVMNATTTTTNLGTQNYISPKQTAPWQAPNPMSQNCAPYQPPVPAVTSQLQAPALPQIDSRQAMNTLSHLNQNNSKTMQWHTTQQTASPSAQHIPVNPPPAEKASLQSSTTEAMITTQARITQAQPNTNVSSAVSGEPMCLYMQLQIGPSIQNAIPGAPNAASTAECENAVGRAIDPYMMSSTQSHPVIDLTSNTPPATPISNDLPVLDSAYVTDVLGATPAKRARMKVASQKTGNCVEEKSLLKELLASVPHDWNSGAEQTPTTAECQKQLEPKNVANAVDDKVSSCESNEGKSETRSANESDTKDTTVDVKPEGSLWPIATAANQAVRNENNYDDDGDFEILIETYTEWKPKIEKIEKIEKVEEEQTNGEALNNAAKRADDDARNNNNNDEKNKCDEPSDLLYDDISSDSEISVLVMDIQ